MSGRKQGGGQGQSPRLAPAFVMYSAWVHVAFKQGLVVVFRPHWEVQKSARELGVMSWQEEEGWARAVYMPPLRPEDYPVLIVSRAVEVALKEENDIKLAISMETIIEEAVQIGIANARLGDDAHAFWMTEQRPSHGPAPQQQPPRPTHGPQTRRGTTPPQHPSQGPRPRRPTNH